MWRSSSIPRKYVSLWCLLFHHHLSTHQSNSNSEVQSRKVTKIHPHSTLLAQFLTDQPYIMTCWTSKTCGWRPCMAHFTHEPRAVTMKFWEPKRKCPKAVLTHLQNHHVVRSWTSSVVWSHMWPCPQPMLFQWISIQTCSHTWYDKINQRLWAFGVPWSPGFVLGLPPRGSFWN